jgi:hypothetical protein
MGHHLNKKLNGIKPMEDKKKLACHLIENKIMALTIKNSFEAVC